MYPNFLKCFPFSSFADSINNFPSPSGPYTSQKRHLKPIHRWCSGTNQSTAWIATWNQPASQPARLPHIPCRPCKAFGTSQTNLLCSRKKQQHEPSHPQWTCCSPQKRTVCVPPCIKSQHHPKQFPFSPLESVLRKLVLSCFTFRGLKRSGVLSNSGGYDRLATFVEIAES